MLDTTSTPRNELVAGDILERHGYAAWVRALSCAVESGGRPAQELKISPTEVEHSA